MADSEATAEESRSADVDRNDSVLHVSCRCTDNTTMVLQLEPTASVAVLKAAFYDASKRAPTHAVELQRVIFNGRVLGDTESLASCGVTSGACIHVALRTVPAVDTPAAETAAAAPGDELATAALLAQLTVLTERARRRARRLEVDAEREASQRAEVGDPGDLMLGLTMGLLLGFMAVICFQHPNASGRMKVGLMLGVFLNLSGFLNVRSRHPGTDTNFDR
jgi:hypothetical protein